MTKVQTLPAAFIKTLQVFAIIFAILLVYAVWAPKAHAAALTDTQTQAIISLLSSFGADQSVLSNVQLALSGASRDDILKAMGAGAASSSPRGDWQNAPGSMGSSTPPFACPAFDRTLARGATGDDVSSLQMFLQRSGDLDATTTTGFFGSTTEVALKAWQAKQGVATSGDKTTTGFGAAGPKTRAALGMACVKMQIQQKKQDRPMGSTTPLTPPHKPRPGDAPTSTPSTLQKVSTLFSSGAAAVFEGYLSLFGQ